jgi:hypothetical protein
MPKTFRVEDRHDVLAGHVWYGPEVLVLVEPGQQVAIHYAPDGNRGACIGRHTYEDLDEEKPPPGLRRARDRSQ